MVNQYRCETCGNAIKSGKTILNCKLVEEVVTNNCAYCGGNISLIPTLGCASHSDFEPNKHAIENAITFACENHDKDIQQKEREKVLDEFMNKIVSSRFALDDGLLVVRMSDVRVIREELRQEVGARKGVFP